MIDVDYLKESLTNELKKHFQLEFGVSATWLNSGSPLKYPLENVLFFKKPVCDSKSIIIDDTPYQNLYPMNE